MTPVSFKCPRWLIFTILGVALVIGLIMPYCFIRFAGLPRVIFPYFTAVAGLLVIYVLSLLPDKIEVSDEGIKQRTLLHRFKIRWEDMVEWRFSKTVDINIFWIKERNGKMHNLKTLLLMGMRTNQVIRFLRDRGIPGREGIGR